LGKVSPLILPHNPRMIAKKKKKEVFRKKAMYKKSLKKKERTWEIDLGKGGKKHRRPELFGGVGQL